MRFQVSRDPPIKNGGMPNPQQYPLNLNLINNVEENVVFLASKVFNSVNFSIVSKARYVQVTVVEKPQIK